MAFAEFQIPIQVHPCAVLKHRKTPQNIGSSASVALRFKSNRSASRSAVSALCRRFMYASLWTHRRSSSLLLSGLGQRRWEAGTTVIHLRFRLSPCSRHGIVAASHSMRNFSVQTVLPNPSTRTSPRVNRFLAFGCSPSLAAVWYFGVLAAEGVLGRRCGATVNRLHIYKRPCCGHLPEGWRCGPRYEPLNWAPFAPRGWA